MEITDPVRRRLISDDHIWLTTVTPSGQPHSSLVWFLPDGDDELIIYSLPSLRTRNIGDGAKVALNLNSHGGGGVVTFTGEARIDDTLPSPSEHEAYMQKYEYAMVVKLGMDPNDFAARYHVPIRVALTSVRAW